MTPKVTSIDTPTSASSYYAPATISPSNLTVRISGQVGTTEDGTTPTDYESQIHLSLFNLRKALTASGCQPTDISKMNIYIVNYDANKRLHTKHIQKFLGGHRPAMTLVPVPALAMPEWLIEIDAVAVHSPSTSTSLPQMLSIKGVDNQVDVVIVGAGLSGLIAARDVIRAGLCCVVLEARDRVGGKTWSQPMKNGKGIVDVGAAWINDTNQSRMYALAKQFGAELIEQNTTGNCVFQDYDGSCKPFMYGELPPLNPSTQFHLASIRDMCEAGCQKLDVMSPQDANLDSLTFAAYLSKNNASPIAIEIATIWTRAMLGQEPTAISALFFLNYCKSGGGLLQMRSDRKDGGQYLRMRQGTQFISTSLAASLPAQTIQLSSPVSSITQLSPNKVAVTTTAHKTYHAKKVILSVPTPIYKTISFTPPLPYTKTLLSNSAVYGYYTKVMILFTTAFWVEKGYCGLAQSFTGPASVIRDTSDPAAGKHILTCFLAGSLGTSWSRLPPSERTSVLLSQIADMWMDSDKKAVESGFIEAVACEWTQEEYSGWGCPCTSFAPGVLGSAGGALRESVGGVHFVGTETAGEWKGYMEGAVRSGERGADEVVCALRREQARL